MLLLLAITACRPETQVNAGEARISLPSTLDFGQVVVGTQATARVPVESQGVGDLELLAASLSSTAPAGMEVVGFTDVPVVRGDLGEIEIRFSPTETGAWTTSLEVESNDEDTPLATVSITAEATAPLLELQPQTLWFGDLDVGESATLQVDLLARGSGTLRISDLQAADPDFTWALAGDAELPLVLEAGSGLSLSVTCAPSDSEPKDARLVFVGNGAEGSHESLRLLANTGETEGPPTAQITAPAFGSHHWSDERVSLEGLAVDQGDAPEDLLVAWYADSALLGTSVASADGLVSLETELPEGNPLRLTLRVLDSQGNSAEDAIDLGVFAPGEPTQWVLSGGETVYDFIVVDDDLRVELDAQVLLSDESGSKSALPPITFEGNPGQVLSWVATDQNYCQKSLSPLTLHWGSERSWALSEEICASACAEDACYDGSYSGPWPQTFGQDSVELPQP